MKPVILLTHKTKTVDWAFGPDYNVHSNYARSIIKAGGVPLLTAGGDPAEMARIADGILFTGGVDVDPAFYGEPMNGSHDVDPALDEMELQLFEAFFRAGKPIFGICRGIQLINVALGGTLWQDIPSQAKAPVMTKLVEGGSDCHPMNAVKGSAIEGLFGERFYVNSFHHQGVKNPGRGLIVTARNDEGIAEAVEHESLPLLAVQWHPERMIGEECEDLPDMVPLFRYFVDLCKKGY